MALRNIPHLYMPDANRFCYGGNLGFGSTRSHYPIFMVPKTGTITHVGFRLANVSSSQTVRVGLETVSTSDGRPTGSQYGGSAVGTQTSPTSNTYYEVALATPASAVQGDVIAAAIQWNLTGGTADFHSGQNDYRSEFPYHDEVTSGTSHTFLRRWPNVSIKYSDGTYPDFGGFPAALFADVTYNSGSTPDEHALRFSLPFNCRIAGSHFLNTVGTSSDFDVVLYDKNGTTVLTSQSIDGNQWRGTGDDAGRIFFDTSVVLKRNTVYRLSIKPTTANNVKVRKVTVANANVMNQMPGGTNFSMSTRTNDGAWTDDTLTFPNIGVILDQIEDGQYSDYFRT